MRLVIVLAAAASVLAVAGCARAQSGDAAADASASAPTKSPVAFLAENALADGVKVLPSGVQYKVLKSGPADGPHPTPDDVVQVNYEGTLLDGTVFDTTMKPGGKPVSFQLGGLISGWVVALQQMRPGDEWIIWVPPALGYGDKQTGPIPANSVLKFRLQLLKVGGPAPDDGQ